MCNSLKIKRRRRANYRDVFLNNQVEFFVDELLQQVTHKVQRLGSVLYWTHSTHSHITQWCKQQQGFDTTATTTSNYITLHANYLEWHRTTVASSYEKYPLLQDNVRIGLLK